VSIFDEMLFPKAVKMILNGSGKLVLIVALVFPLAVAMSGPVALAKETGTITGLVFDPQGATGPSIEVELRWNDAGGEMCWTPPNLP
jgi:hypothetical protein